MNTEMEWAQSGRDALLSELQEMLEHERWDDIAILLDDYFFALSLAAPDAVLDLWSRAPRDWVHEHPRYLMAREISRNAWRSSAATERRLERTFADWVAGQDAPAARDVLGVKTAAIRRSLVYGRLDQALKIVDEAQELIRTAQEHDGFDDVLGSVLLRLGLARLLAGDLDAAIESFSEGWRWSRSTLPHPIAPYLAGHCALAHALAGDFAHAEEWLARSETDISTDPRTMTFHLQKAAVLARPLIDIAHFDRAAAEAYLTQSHHDVDSGELWWIDVHARARIALYWGEADGAVRLIERTLQAYPSLTAPGSLAGMILRANLSDLRQSQGDLDAAEQVLDAIDATAAHPSVVTSRARILMKKGQTEDALALIDRAARGRRRGSSIPSRWQVLRANAAQLMHAPNRPDAIRVAADRIASTRAYDAADEALPRVHDAIAERTRLPPGLRERYPSSRGAAPDGGPASAERANLTQRELQILELLRTHTAVRDLAAAMFISANTAKSHLRNLYRKLGATGRDDALRRADEL
ncbi:LuxR C-terminal-related transcriptional regulator [Microbacterium sp. NPDC087665]|uniref:helix-turn-helix transcriptional regulator n=1 Tax=Microbacterium sp. NPDC087665 TaxID=3364194 RepID=UPI0037F7C7C3